MTAPTNKARAAGVSASSFFDLKAEIAKKEDEFARTKAAGGSKYTVGGVKRPDKKPTVWSRSNKGVHNRAARDIELEEVSKVTIESGRAVLERKAKIYEKLRKGKSGGLTDKQYEALLVDFDSRGPSDHFESDSDDMDESLTVPEQPQDDDDPIIEYEDEFGRQRTGRRSEVPRHLLPRSEDTEPIPDEDKDVIYNPVNYFPVFEPSAERIQAVQDAYSEDNNPLSSHYDASKEVRAKGAGYYQFSGDEETRRQQMEELQSARIETEKIRQDAGAVDLKPGEVEGMRDDSITAGASRSRAMEKRKRDIEERRKILDAKRRKVKGDETLAGRGLEPDNSEAVTLEAQDTSGPLVALERQTTDASDRHKRKGKQKGTDDSVPKTEADDFLAQLEREILGGR
ncbi:uncharacterized protein F5891DRAFT_1008473 [Suillus fuscotomentosus]|uniref:Uncharacterized protein n=1 Tax=Suillus fuscotomentosus TaxID=1912939 RepID=A0AAD4EFN8_9AGAM|nr:uncharacterized protein F5891DRAFT_1008473 [Suillus fuscotomentosus]KAG1905272.1 hypothetical protein F5891DRAFT_1008473 [Suillus fuscotomentosus]